MFGLLVLVGLFVALTPGILFRLKGSKMVSAAMHAVLFAVAAYLVSVYFMSYDGFTTLVGETRMATEGVPVLAADGPPITPSCPPGSTLSTKNYVKCLIDTVDATATPTTTRCPKWQIKYDAQCYSCTSPYVVFQERGFFKKMPTCINAVPPECPESYVLNEAKNRCILFKVNMPIDNGNGETIDIGSRVKCRNTNSKRLTYFNGTVSEINNTYSRLLGTRDDGTLFNVRVNICSLLPETSLDAGSGLVGSGFS